MLRDLTFVGPLVISELTPQVGLGLAAPDTAEHTIILWAWNWASSPGTTHRDHRSRDVNCEFGGKCFSGYIDYKITMK